MRAIGIDALLAEGRARRKRHEEERRAEFWAERSPIPELDLMPDCSICGSYDMEYEDGFYCPGCNVQWDRNGDKGERLPSDDCDVCRGMGRIRESPDSFVPCPACVVWR